mgnify:CR=1
LLTIPRTRAVSPASKPGIVIWEHVYGTVIRGVRVTKARALSFGEPIIGALFTPSALKKTDAGFIGGRRERTGVTNAGAVVCVA